MTSFAEQLLYCTTRIETRKVKGGSIGTGFFFLYEERMFLVTNKHVIEDVVKGKFTVLKGREDGGEIKPVLGQSHEIEFVEGSFIGHPDPNIDVAVANASEALNEIKNREEIAHYAYLNENVFPTQEEIDDFISPIEEIIFIGYPNGIWDSTNILPIVRKGITATPYYSDFKGQEKFIIDASVFPGSSGSPVFIYNAGGFLDRKGALHISSRLYFLGIVAQVYTQSEQGDVEITNIPTQQSSVVANKQMIDLGVVFKAETIRECADHFIKEIKKSGKG